MRVRKYLGLRVAVLKKELRSVALLRTAERAVWETAVTMAFYQLPPPVIALEGPPAVHVGGTEPVLKCSR